MSAISVETRWERLLAEQDGEARAALARRLRREPPPSEGMMTRALRSTDAGLRKLVAWIAGGLPWAAASTPIRHALQDARPTVRRAAVMALAAHPGDEPAGLLGGATADADLAVASTAATALYLHSRAAVEPLLNAARDARPEVQSSALRSLAALKPEWSKRVAKVALDALRAPDERVRAAACQLLGSAGEGDVAEALQAALVDRSTGVRERAAAALRDIAARSVR